MNRTRLTDSERVAMQSVETFLRETFLRCLYVVARSAERDAVRLGVVAHRTHRLTTHGPNHIVHIQTITRTPPVRAHRPIVTYLQFPIQVCFPRNDHAQPAAYKAPTSVTDTLVVLIVV